MSDYRVSGGMYLVQSGSENVVDAPLCRGVFARRQSAVATT